MTSVALEEGSLLHATASSADDIDYNGQDQSWSQYLFGDIKELFTSGVSKGEVTIKEYLEIQSGLLSSRKKIKGKIGQSMTTHANAQTDLIDTYSRFRKYVIERDTEPWQAEEEEYRAGGSFAITHRFSSAFKSSSEDKWMIALLEQNEKALTELRKVIVDNKTVLASTGAELEAQQKSFSVFLNDQGRVLQVVEKATARNSTKGNDFKRSQMYKTIVRSLEDSPAMEVLPPQEREKHKKEIYQILRQLELVEGKTDELVERVLLKLQAIQRSHVTSWECAVRLFSDM